MRNIRTAQIRVLPDLLCSGRQIFDGKNPQPRQRLAEPRLHLTGRNHQPGATICGNVLGVIHRPVQLGIFDRNGNGTRV